MNWLGFQGSILINLLHPTNIINVFVHVNITIWGDILWKGGIRIKSYPTIHKRAKVPFIRELNGDSYKRLEDSFYIQEIPR